eukprot:6185615-Pleurochrysis_carterae.AAC.3
MNTAPAAQSKVQSKIIFNLNMKAFGQEHIRTCSYQKCRLGHFLLIVLLYDPFQKASPQAWARDSLLLMRNYSTLQSTLKHILPEDEQSQHLACRGLKTLSFVKMSYRIHINLYGYIIHHMYISAPSFTATV